MKVLIFGGSGLVGSKFIELHKNNFEIKSPLVNEVDILSKDQILKVAQEFNPDAVVNFAAFTNVEVAEDQKGDKQGICYLINAEGAKNVADICKTLSKHLIHISTEYVFDGTKGESPYAETDKPNPINWYGQTKYFGEQFVLESGCQALIMRISMPFSSYYELKSDIGRKFLDLLKSRAEIKAINDQKITPTLVDDIANALKLFIERETLGLYHVCSKNSTTPFEFAVKIARAFNLDKSLIKPVGFDEYNKNKSAKLLKNSWLSSRRFNSKFGSNILHTFEEAVRLFKSQINL